MFDPAFRKPFPDDVQAVVGSGWWRPRAAHPHYGMDIPIAVGTPVVAMADGVVYKAQRSSSGAAGMWVGIRHANDVKTRYLHLSKVYVDVGQRVAKGAPIGLSGNTGDSEGPHLHLEVRVPPALLPAVAAEVGEPKTGWGPDLDGQGMSIPPEPWVPVDDYRLSTVVRDHANGVVLYRDRVRGRASILSKAPLVAGGVVALGSIALAVVAKRRHWID